MTSCTKQGLVLFLTLSLGFGAADAQERGQPSTQSAASKPAAASQPAGDADAARAVLEKALAMYRGLESYGDRVDMRYEVQVRPDAEAPGNLGGLPARTTVTLVYSRPNRLALSGPGMRLI